MGNFFFVFFGAVIILMVVIAVLSIRAERKRTEGLQKVAGEMGFEFTAEPHEKFLGCYPGFHLFSQGSDREIRNLLRGKAGGLEVSIFDYSYVTSGGNSRKTWRQTVLAFEIDDVNLPGFSLRPEVWLDKVGQWLGYKDINFESYPKFSKMYLLRSGEKEEDVRALFTDRVLEYYEEHPNVCTEGCGGRLVYYRANQRLNAADVRPFLEEGFEVLALFRPPKEAT
jgi:hypothetical protein